MAGRWRGRGAALASGLIATALLGVAGPAPAGLADATGAGQALRVSTADGRLLARVELGADGDFTLRYRNSLYGTLAEERFVVTEDGRMRLVELGAEQLAVLEEYYGASRAARSATAPMAWTALPAHAPVERTLRIAATDLGERTLLVPGAAPLELHRLVDDASPTVVLEVTAADD